MRLVSSAVFGVLLCALRLASAVDFGVGFSLAFDYGVASVHFPNGSTANIARLAGSEAYRSAMKHAHRLQAYPGLGLGMNHSELVELFGPEMFEGDDLDCSSCYAEKTALAEHYLPDLQRYLPEWLKMPDTHSAYKRALQAMGGLRAQAEKEYRDSEPTDPKDRCDCYTDYGFKTQNAPSPSMSKSFLPSWFRTPEPERPSPGDQALINMINALKVATESYLGTEIHNATIAAPFHFGEHHYNAIGRASTTLQLNPLWRANAALIATWLNYIPTDCPYEQRHAPVRELGQYHALVLGVDFSEAALSATLLVNECGVFDTARVLSSTKLGARELFATNDSHAKLVDAFRRVAALPLPADLGLYDVNEMDHITQLVQLGDAVRDYRFQGALREALGEQYSVLTQYPANTTSSSREPEFVAAAGSALQNWHRAQYPPFDFSCVPHREPDWFDRMAQKPWWPGTRTYILLDLIVLEPLRFVMRPFESMLEPLHEIWDPVQDAFDDAWLWFTHPDPWEVWDRDARWEARTRDLDEQRHREHEDYLRNPLLIGPP